jgi:hypothetical protein
VTEVRLAHPKAKRTEYSRRNGVVRTALERTYGELTALGQHDRAKLVEIALRALPDEALGTIYKAVEDDCR